MKSIIRLLVLGLALNAVASDNVRLNFFVKHGVGKEIVLAVFDNYITRDTWNYIYEIDSSGRGVVSFKLDRSREAFFQAGRNYFLFLTPRDLTMKAMFDEPIKVTNKNVTTITLICKNAA